MVNLYFIKCCAKGECGYVADETILRHGDFSVKFIKADTTHKLDTGLVLFFSRGQAEVICDRIVEIANDRKPSNDATMEVVSDVFDQEFADALMNRKHMFTYEDEDE